MPLHIGHCVASHYRQRDHLPKICIVVSCSHSVHNVFQVHVEVECYVIYSRLCITYFLIKYTFNLTVVSLKLFVAHCITGGGSVHLGKTAWNYGFRNQYGSM